MKKRYSIYLIIIGLLLLVMACHTAEAKSLNDKYKSIIIEIGNIAKSVMEARQVGAPKEELVEAIMKSSDTLKVSDLTLVIIKDAYRYPIGKTLEEQDKCIEVFHDRWLVWAYTTLINED